MAIVGIYFELFFNNEASYKSYNHLDGRNGEGGGGGESGEGEEEEKEEGELEMEHFLRMYIPNDALWIH